jgi:hypothetical protein
MKKLLSLLVLTLALSSVVAAQGPPNKASQLTHVAGVYVASNYTGMQFIVDNPSSVAAASPATLILRQPSFALRDGTTIYPFVNEKVTIGSGASQETVTITAISGCSAGAGYDSCTITGNTSNSHGRGDVVASATGGLYEAIQDAGNNGGGSVYWEVDCNAITLSTSSATTTTTCNVPQSFTTLGVSVYVQTAITTAVSYSLGISGHTSTFMASCTAVAAAATCSQFVPAPTALATGTGQAALLVTANAAAGAGVIHAKVWGYVGAQSNY